MSGESVLTVTWWAVLIAGFVPSSWFLLRYWPRRWLSGPAVVLRGFAFVVFLAYLRPIGALLLAGGVPVFRGGLAQTVWSYGLFVLTDLVVAALVVVAARYRRAYEAEMRREGDVGDG